MTKEEALSNRYFQALYGGDLTHKVILKLVGDDNEQRFRNEFNNLRGWHPAVWIEAAAIINIVLTEQQVDAAIIEAKMLK